MPSQPQALPDPTPLSPVAQRLAEANLAFFVRDRFAPVIDRSISEGRSPLEQNFVRAEILESFLWLHHGVEIGYFPVPLARRVIYEYFPLVLGAYESLRSESYFETWFTSPLRVVFEIEFAGNQGLFSSGRIWEPSKLPSDGDALFQPCLILANDLAQNPGARQLIQAVAVDGDAKWQKVSDQVAVGKFEPPSDWLPSEEVVDDEQAGHWMLSGFFALLDYMRAFRTTKFDFEERFTDSESQDYLRLLKETQQWRLNFGYPKYRERFMLVARMAAETYSKHLPNASWAVADFLQSFYELATDWGSPRSKAVPA